VKSRFTLLALARKVLIHAKRPLTAKAIWYYSVKHGYNKEGNFKGKTPWYSIGAQIYVDMRDNANSSFIKLSTQPVTFFMKGMKYRNLSPDASQQKSTESFLKKISRKPNLILCFLERISSKVFSDYPS